jgi:hypothetical protein
LLLARPSVKHLRGFFFLEKISIDQSDGDRIKFEKRKKIKKTKNPLLKIKKRIFI